MARGFKPRGAGCISEIDEAEGVCSVKWEDGVLENSIYIGQHGIFALVALPDGAAPRTMSSQASEGVRSRSQSREREGGAQMWWDPASRGRQPGYQHAVHEIARARRDASSPGPEGLGQRSLSPGRRDLDHWRSQSPELGVSENTAQRPMRNSSAHARIGNAHAQLHTRAASPDPGSPRSQHRVSHHRWAQGTSGKYADTTVGMGIVGLFVEYVTLFGPAANSRDVDEGDEIVSVEGIDVGNDPDRLVHLISAHHDSRPLVRIKVRSQKRGQQLEVDLVRWPRSQLQVYEVPTFVMCSHKFKVSILLNRPASPSTSFSSSLPPFPPLSVSLCLSLSLIDPDQDVEAKLEDLAALPNGGRAISDDIKQLLSSVKRFEHTREVKQLQETEQLQSRIKVLEAEVAKRQLQETEQLQSRIKVLEAELAKRQIEMSEIETLRLRAHKAEIELETLRIKEAGQQTLRKEQDASLNESLMEQLRVAQRDCESLVTRLQEKDAETRWMENKYVTTKALHVKELEVVAQRMLLLQDKLNERERLLAERAQPQPEVVPIPASEFVPIPVSMPGAIRSLQNSAAEAQRRLAQTVDPNFRPGDMLLPIPQNGLLPHHSVISPMLVP
eukprot:Tamp_06413.p1 GENE.Tamp_06413~~Tamp_06413.p1  ORF type:complete len:666 (-),score=73.29 Tamp_06413:719-2560(-)